MADDIDLYNCFANNNCKHEFVILDEIILKQYGCYSKVRRYIKGRHPHLGPLTIGWSGEWETVWEVDVIKPMAVVTVSDDPRHVV